MNRRAATKGIILAFVFSVCAYNLVNISQTLTLWNTSMPSRWKVSLTALRVLFPAAGVSLESGWLRWIVGLGIALAYLMIMRLSAGDARFGTGALAGGLYVIWYAVSAAVAPFQGILYLWLGPLGQRLDVLPSRLQGVPSSALWVVLILNVLSVVLANLIFRFRRTTDADPNIGSH